MVENLKEITVVDGKFGLVIRSGYTYRKSKIKEIL